MIWTDDAKKPTPKTAVVGGVTFHRSKGGNLWREGVVRKNQRSVDCATSARVHGRSSPSCPHITHLKHWKSTQRHDDRSTQIKKIAKPCKFFTIAGIFSYPAAPSFLFPPPHDWLSRNYVSPSLRRSQRRPQSGLNLFCEMFRRQIPSLA